MRRDQLENTVRELEQRATDEQIANREEFKIKSSILSVTEEDIENLTCQSYLADTRRAICEELFKMIDLPLISGPSISREVYLPEWRSDTMRSIDGEDRLEAIRKMICEDGQRKSASCCLTASDQCR